MKGVSTIIATILMLMITIGLAGTAYMFISGAFTRELQGIEVVDNYCVGGTTARITFRNIGTSDISLTTGAVAGTFSNCGTSTSPATCGSMTVTRTSGGGTADIENDRASVPPGTVASLQDTGCTTAVLGPRTCVYRITPPTGRTIEAAVPCTG